MRTLRCLLHAHRLCQHTACTCRCHTWPGWWTR